MATASAGRADKGSSRGLPRVPRALAARPPRGRRALGAARQDTVHPERAGGSGRAHELSCNGDAEAAGLADALIARKGEGARWAEMAVLYRTTSSRAARSQTPLSAARAGLRHVPAAASPRLKSAGRPMGNAADAPSSDEPGRRRRRPSVPMANAHALSAALQRRSASGFASSTTAPAVGPASGGIRRRIHRHPLRACRPGRGKRKDQRRPRLPIFAGTTLRQIKSTKPVSTEIVRRVRENHDPYIFLLLSIRII